MITISACIIVKNEEAVLSRCLDCVKRFADEIIILDTGSTDRTKEIAREYTNHVYDFEWVQDFSAARNASFSKATMDYIYLADADEIIDDENITKIMQLKEVLIPEIEIVQMLYTNQLEFNTTYNFDVELRPKLYKRLREFSWMDPIHESVRLEPVIYDSEIEVIHKPLSSHAKRDFLVYQKAIQSGNKLTTKLNLMYAKELYIAGDSRDFLQAQEYFNTLLDEELPFDEIKAVQCVLVRAAKETGDYLGMMKHALKNVALDEPSSEVCYELGEYYFEKKDYLEAILWFYNAVYETSSELNIHYNGDFSLKMLWKCYEKIGKMEEAKKYELEYRNWTIEM